MDAIGVFTSPVARRIETEKFVDDTDRFFHFTREPRRSGAARTRPITIIIISFRVTAGFFAYETCPVSAFVYPSFPRRDETKIRRVIITISALQSRDRFGYRASDIHTRISRKRTGGHLANAIDIK